MKKIIVLLITLLSSMAIFAKDKPLQVTETAWGLEISNIDSKGRKICKDYLKYEDKSTGNPSLYIIFKNNTDIFDIDSFINEINLGKLSSSVLVLTGKKFESAPTQRNSWNGNLEYGPLSLYDAVLIIPRGCFVKDYKAYCANNDLHFDVLSIENKDAKLDEIIKQKKAADEELQKKIAEENKRIQTEKKEKLKEQFIKSGREGYDNISWGTKKSEILSLYQNCEKLSSEDPFYPFEIYKRQGSSKDIFLYYYFYNEELVQGETFYGIHNDSQLDDINKRLAELYGKPNDVKNTEEHKTTTFFGTYISYTETHFLVNWIKSPTFYLDFDFSAYQGDTYEDTQNVILWIHQYPMSLTLLYKNKKVVDKALESAEKKRVEANKAEQRKRMDNLDL